MRSVCPSVAAESDPCGAGWGRRRLLSDPFLFCGAMVVCVEPMGRGEAISAATVEGRGGRVRTSADGAALASLATSASSVA